MEGGLSEDLLTRIERNRELAIERLQLTRGAAPGSDVPTRAMSPGPFEKLAFPWSCPKILDCGKVCGSSSDSKIREHFDEVACSRCDSRTNGFDYITKDTIKREYLLPEYVIKQLKHITRPNRLNPRWADIKLFLRKHCIAAAIDKWGSLDALKEQLRMKEQKKYDQSVERTQALLAGDGTTTKQNAASLGGRRGNKRKLHELESMAAIIRGDN